MIWDSDLNPEGLALSWELDLWGRIRSGKSAALGDLQASLADYQGARLSVASLTAKAWLQLISARLVVDLAEDTVESFERSADRVRERWEDLLSRHQQMLEAGIFEPPAIIDPEKLEHLRALGYVE